jgi:hypothetical protein
MNVIKLSKQRFVYLSPTGIVENENLCHYFRRCAEKDSHRHGEVSMSQSVLNHLHFKFEFEAFYLLKQNPTEVE